MRRYRARLTLASTIIAVVVLLGSFTGAAGGQESGHQVSWSPGKISIAISPGGSWGTELILTSGTDLANISLFIPPDLQPFVSISPLGSLALSSDASTTLRIDVAVPADATPGSSYEGTVHVKSGRRTHPQVLKVLVYIAEPLETLTEEAYNGTLALDIEASQMFDELQSDLGPDAAGRAVVDWLKQQEEVLDAGTSDDGSIWIVYKIGLDAVLPTAPPGTLGSGSSSLSYQTTQDALQLMSACTRPERDTVILLWPLCSDPAYQPTEGPNWTEVMVQIRGMLSANGYSVLGVPDAYVTVDLLKSIYVYGVVDFFTHGSKFMSSEVMLATGEEADFDSFLRHWNDIRHHRLARRSVVEGTWMIRPSFIRHYATQLYPRSLVNVAACFGLANHTMANAFLDNGAHVYCGWSKETTCSLTRGLYEHLTAGKSLGETYADWVEQGETTCARTSATWSYYPSDRGDLCLIAVEVVHFPDPNLEAAIREAIGKPTGNIYPSDLEGLTYLDAWLRNISDLTGLEHCTSLTSLNLYGNRISDISPVSSLTHLTLLWLWDNQISDISPVSSLLSLKTLNLGCNQISDISDLSSLTGLRVLYLGDNQVSDISDLSSLTGLGTLDLGGNQISDFSLLSSFTNLTWLYLFDSQISDISFLDSLTNLKWLWLWGNQISDISPLDSLTNLTGLFLDHNQISDISPLAGLTSLTGLHLGTNQISDISPLANLTDLEYLELELNQIGDISPLANLTSLRSLTLRANEIGDISPLAGLTSLTRLYLGTNQVSDISPLAGLTSLTRLTLSSNEISDISPLASLTSLTRLSLGSNQISDVSPLVDNIGLGAGDYVDLTNNPLSVDSVNEYISALQARGVIVYY